MSCAHRLDVRFFPAPVGVGYVLRMKPRLALSGRLLIGLPMGEKIPSLPKGHLSAVLQATLEKYFSYTENGLVLIPRFLSMVPENRPTGFAFLRSEVG